MAFYSVQNGNIKTQVFITEYDLVDMFVGNTLFSYGNNGLGGIGDSTTATKSTPTQEISKSHKWSQISYNGGTSAAIGDDGNGNSGALWLWGFNGSGGLGDGTTVNKSSPVQTIAGGIDWKYVSVGQSHTTALKTDATLWVWGDNTYGQLGNGTTGNTSIPQFIGTIQLGAENQFDGSQQSAVIIPAGTLWLCGLGSSGGLGDNTTVDKSSPVQTIAGGTNWSQVSCGYYATAAIKTDGTLWLWGYNGYGQLGTNTITTTSSPVQTICGGTDWKQVSQGNGHTVAVKTDGTLWTWGWNTHGQLGDNTIVRKSSPVQTIAGGTNWTSVACDNQVSAAIKTDGTLWLWGQDFYGQLGIPGGGTQLSPVQTVAGGTNWKQVSTDGVAVAAVKTDGTLWAWGYNAQGQLGDGTRTNRYVPLQTTLGGTDWDSVSCDRQTVAAVKTDGTLWTWGWNDKGQLGDGTILPRSSPVQVVAGGNIWSQVRCGTGCVVASKTDGTLWVWGNNQYGQLGDGTITNTSIPTQSALSTFSLTTIPSYWEHSSSGYQHTAGIKPDYSLWVWGDNTYGQLGNGTTTNISSPIQTAAGGTNWKHVSCGYHHTAAIKTDGTLWIWGDNSNGQLGDGTIVNTSSPIQTISGGYNWNSVVCGHHHTAATKTDGTLWLWGANAAGQLGNSNTTGMSSPIQTIAGGTNWKKVSCGTDHTAAVKTDGTNWAWGNNFNGQLGNGNTTNTSSPVQNTMAGHNWKQVSCGGNITGALTFADI